MGAVAWLGQALDRVTSRQVAPLLAALVLAAEAASALAGAMVVMAQQEGWAALRLLGRTPRTWWGAAALWRGIVGGASYTFVGWLAFVAGGAIVLSVLGRSLEPWMGAFLRPGLFGDIGTGVLKGAFFGLGVQLTAFCTGEGAIRALAEGRGPAGEEAVGEAAGTAVVRALLFLAMAEAIWVFLIEVKG